MQRFWLEDGSRYERPIRTSARLLEEAEFVGNFDGDGAVGYENCPMFAAIFQEQTKTPHCLSILD
jgi:hypothetical protein